MSIPNARGTLCPILMLLVLCATGCSTTSPTTRNGSLDQAIAAYDAGRYASARQQAETLALSADSRERRAAAYVAGLSAYRLGDLLSAESHLTVAARSTDTITSGNARATLGLVLMDQNRPREAAPLFAEASSQLGGDDARQAARHAAEAYSAMGDQRSAETWQATARRLGTSSGSSASPGGSTTGPTTESGVFALQVGAFQNAEHARRASTNASAIATRYRLGAVHIIPGNDERGDRLYFVQFGRFTTRQRAAEVRSRIGELEYIVVPALTPGS